MLKKPNKPLLPQQEIESTPLSHVTEPPKPSSTFVSKIGLLDKCHSHSLPSHTFSAPKLCSVSAGKPNRDRP